MNWWHATIGAAVMLVVVAASAIVAFLFHQWIDLVVSLRIAEPWSMLLAFSPLILVMVGLGAFIGGRIQR